MVSKDDGKWKITENPFEKDALVPKSPEEKGLTTEDKSAIEDECFTPGTLNDWKVVAVGKIDEDKKFLCLDWVLVRLYQLVMDTNDQQKAAAKKQIEDLLTNAMARETDHYKTAKDQIFTDIFKKFGLEQCALTADSTATVIAWSSDNYSVGHVQVQYNKNWESKLSNSPWVITHGKDAFDHFENFKMKKCGAYGPPASGVYNMP